MKQKYVKCLILAVLAGGIYLHTYATEDTAAEILSMKAKDNTIYIEVAKTYPSVHFRKFDEQNKIVIEFLDSKYHNLFKFNTPTKNNLINGLNFITNVSVGTAKDKGDTTKVAIILSTDKAANVFPKLLSTKNNFITISLEELREITHPGNENSEEEIQAKTALRKEEETKEEEITEPINPQQILKNLYNKAIEENTNNNFARAESIYKQIISIDRNFYSARYNLAKLYYDQSKYDQALDILLELSKEIEEIEEPSTDKTLVLLAKNMLGSIYLLKGESKNAKEQFHGILDIDPLFYEAHFNLGIIHEREEKVKKAIKSFREAVKISPDLAKGYFHLGVLHLVLKHKKDAIFNFNKVIEISPNSKIAQLSKSNLESLEK